MSGGNPGNKGGTGRPTNEFRDECRLLLEDPKVKRAVISVLRNPKHGQFSNLWGKVAAYGYGTPPDADDPSLLAGRVDRLSKVLRTLTDDQLRARLKAALEG